MIGNASVTSTARSATFFHAGCPVCVSAGQQLVHAPDATRYRVEVVRPGEQKGRLDKAERPGVKSVPALVIDGQPFHIDSGASRAALK